MKIIVEGEKIISVGWSDYVLREGQKQFEIDSWNGKRKDECKWVNGKVVKKTQKEIDNDKQAKEEKEKQQREQPILDAIYKLIDEGIL